MLTLTLNNHDGSEKEFRCLSWQEVFNRLQNNDHSSFMIVCGRHFDDIPEV